MNRSDFIQLCYKGVGYGRLRPPEFCGIHRERARAPLSRFARGRPCFAHLGLQLRLRFMFLGGARGCPNKRSLHLSHKHWTLPPVTVGAHEQIRSNKNTKSPTHNGCKRRE